MNRLIRIRKGFDVPIAGEPEQVVYPGAPVRNVALCGVDHVGLRPRLLVSVGDAVGLGQPLWEDKRDPAVCYPSPGRGVVTAVNRGTRRVLESVVVSLQDSGARDLQFEALTTHEIEQLDRDAVAERMLRSGLWTALRTRPFSRVPQSGSTPDSIFVTAIDTRPLAPDPKVVIARDAEHFALGLQVLTRLTEGRVWLCTAPDWSITLPGIERVTRVSFTGPHPAGLPGTHIHMLHPVSAKRSVWHLAMQETVSIGRLITTGRLWTERVIALSGPMVSRPRMIRTRLGASLNDLLAAELEPGKCRVVSGSVLDGHRATTWAAYLGRFSRQVTVLPEGEPRRFLGWLMPGMDRYSAVPSFGGALKSSRFPLSTTMNGSARAMVPIGNFESILPLDMLPAPLLKALIVGDTDMAQKLGCLELDQEDLALCSFVCPSKYDYGAYLRDSLNKIEKEG